MTPTLSEPPELELLNSPWERRLRDEHAASRRRGSLIVSLVVHVVVIPLLPYIPNGPVPNYQGGGVQVISVHRAIPLIEPQLPEATQLTQKAPNKGQVARAVSMSDLMPRSPSSQALPGGPSVSPKPSPDLMEAPKVEVARLDPQQIPAPQIPTAAAAAPQIQPVEKRNPFEKVTVAAGPPNGTPRIEVPRYGAEAAIHDAVRGAGQGGLVVGDDLAGPSAGQALGQESRPGKSKSNIELLSDQQGVDFTPYITQVLAAVRRNWFAVMPGSVRMGQRGKVVLVFSILRSGKIGKLVLSTESGLPSLDRAAVTGVSASDPFPPLPADFKGNEIRLSMVFAYNQPAAH